MKAFLLKASLEPKEISFIFVAQHWNQTEIAECDRSQSALYFKDERNDNYFVFFGHKSLFLPLSVPRAPDLATFISYEHRSFALD